MLINFLNNLIIKGRIPYFIWIKKALLFLAFSPLVAYFLLNFHYTEYGELGWNVLIAVMLIRPLADIFADFGILKTLVLLRKEFGIFSGLLIFIHSYDFFAKKGQNIFIEMFNSKYWSFDDIFLWGILGFIITIILLITSNKISIKILKKHWKTVQRSAYLLFFFSAVHIVLVNKQEMFETLFPVTVVLIFWVLAQLNIKISILKKTE
ncbi:hypothetical protein KKA95_04015 [Patescibacteria group bacterium]|nr:hypothetical protein [Patescibacteria group bacterium]